jgi:hypothetical protein
MKGEDPWKEIFSGNFMIATCYGPEAEENARRIVACVNALEGIDTDRLEIAVSCGSGFWGRAIKEADIALLTMKTQRDKLLSAVTKAAKDFINQNGIKPEWWTAEIVDMVIANNEAPCG